MKAGGETGSIIGNDYGKTGKPEGLLARLALLKPSSAFSFISKHAGD